jgi:hypothetical protein
MNLFLSSRRLFIAGAATSAAVVGTIGLVKTFGKPAVGKSIVDPTPLAGGKGGVSETDLWAGLINQSFMIAGAAGAVPAKLTKVQPQTVSGKRPAEIRQQPVALTFTLDRGFDAAGDAIYAVRQKGGVASELFLQRGADATGTRLVALLA